MTIHVRGDWHYDYDIEPYEGRFFWHVVRLRIDRTRASQVVLGAWVAGGIAVTREEAERECTVAINRDFEQLAKQHREP